MERDDGVMQANEVNREVGPELRTFAPKATSPCLQKARQASVVSNWVGNCGCTCLCPNPPK